MEIKNKKGEVLLETNEEDLIGIDLSAAYLIDADLRGADLGGTDLSAAYLIDADLRGACLRGAYLRGADLRGVNLIRADLRGVNLICAENYYSFIAYDTSKRIVHCVKHDKQWMIKADCFWGTPEELEKKVKQTHNSPVYLANIEILKNL
jgi:hypothetical protein